jgi:probable phosphoglycerate mutase
VPLTICFVRHGESRANVERVFANRADQPFALTDAGRDQARELAEKLRALAPSRIYSSPLPRAVETAGVIADHLGVPITETDALREFDVGAFEGLPYGDVHAWRWDEHVRIGLAWSAGDLDARHPGGESASDIAARFLPFMTALAERHAEGCVALVGHGGLYLTALPMLLAGVSIADARRFGLGHCEVVTATHDAGVWTCLAWGDHRLS